MLGGDIYCPRPLFFIAHLIGDSHLFLPYFSDPYPGSSTTAKSCDSSPYMGTHAGCHLSVIPAKAGAGIGGFFSFIRPERAKDKKCERLQSASKYSEHRGRTELLTLASFIDDIGDADEYNGRAWPSYAPPGLHLLIQLIGLNRNGR